MTEINLQQARIAVIGAGTIGDWHCAVGNNAWSCDLCF